MLADLVQVYSCAGSLDYFIFGCLTSDFMYLSFSPLFSVSSRQIDIVVFARNELNFPHSDVLYI